MFANDTSLFSIVSDLLETANILNEALDKIRQWAEQWKIAFNRNPTKQVQEFVFFKKKPQESFHPNLYFNKFVVEKVQTQKHLGLKLDKKLSFEKHLKDEFAKVNRGIELEIVLKSNRFFVDLNILQTLFPPHD